MTHLYATLRCGNDRWGFRHIRDRHYDDYQAKANLIGRNWRDFFDWSTRWALKDPDRITWQPNPKTWCYDRQFQFIVDNEVIMKTRVRVVLNTQGKGFVTAWPTTTSRCSGEIQ